MDRETKFDKFCIRVGIPLMFIWLAFLLVWGVVALNASPIELSGRWFELTLDSVPKTKITNCTVISIGSINDFIDYDTTDWTYRIGELREVEPPDYGIKIYTDSLCWGHPQSIWVEEDIDSLITSENSKAIPHPCIDRVPPDTGRVVEVWGIDGYIPIYKAYRKCDSIPNLRKKRYRVECREDTAYSRFGAMPKGADYWCPFGYDGEIIRNTMFCGEPFEIFVCYKTVTVCDTVLIEEE